MTLHQKINELNELGYGVKFERSTFERSGNNIVIKIRFQRVGSSVVFENTEHMVHARYMNESFVIDVLDRMYKDVEAEKLL